MDLAVSGAMYKGLGYDFLAITDHNRTHDEAQVAEWSDKAGIIVIPGEENGKTDHIIELGVHSVAETTSDDYLERARALKDGGGFLMGCHPQEYPDGRGERNIERSWQELDAVEIYNGLREARGTDETANVQLWDRILTAGGRIWGVATDDFHCQYVGPGCGWVQVQVPEDVHVTWQTIVNQMKKGAFYSSTYPVFESIVFADDQLAVKVDKRTRGIRIIGPGGSTLAESDGAAIEWSAPSGLEYFRIEAFSGIKRGWSQPFYRAVQGEP